MSSSIQQYPHTKEHRAARIRVLRAQGLTWQQVQASFQREIGYGFSVNWLQETLKADDARLARKAVDKEEEGA